ncbi:TVP38/TMEM64 family protein [Actinokineospora xionganensis]|uniref:TVP38/TMEM64 family membrane protein n=1 Tax=Actinokineospora xionganensis TaxID=2684470 RepID=A0ABR7L1Y0_9PSEU|nr:VTT domain-containing protein [Actinokineospora xionganensis]MBC6446696.1 TVP38/TMEM64 family protein [Actinokineospora xionganensis]
MSGRKTLIIALVGVVALVVAGSLAPAPSPAEVRGWAAAAGWATPVVFLAVYAVLTVVPIPRTVFNLSAGLLLGEALGVAVAMLATALAAWTAFLLARGLGRKWLESHLERDAVRTVNARLSGGGIAGMISLRLIPMIPFAPVNYCCGISTIRLGPFLAGTVIGSLPGTIAVVILGDALTGTTPPALLAVYAGLALVGGAGLYAALRKQGVVASAD